MNICMVGYGAIAEKHMEAFSGLVDVHPGWLVGRRREPAGEFAARWGFVHQSLDLDDALSDPEVDAVVITSPNELHAEQAAKSLQAGKHVLLEIPMALNVADAEYVTKLSRQVDRRLMVAHTMRYFPAIQEVQRRVANGDLKIHHMVGFFGLLRRTNVTSAGRPRSWTDDLLWHFGAHMVDIALWTAGHKEAEHCHWSFGPSHPTQGIMDIGLAMSLPGGELFTLAMSYNVQQLRWKLNFIGEESTLDFDMGTLLDPSGNTVIPHQSITDLREQNRAFVESVRGGRDPAITGEDILPTMQILQEAQDRIELAAIRQ